MDYLEFKEIKLNNGTYRKEPPSNEQIMYKINEIIDFINDKNEQDHEEWKRELWSDGKYKAKKVWW